VRVGEAHKRIELAMSTKLKNLHLKYQPCILNSIRDTSVQMDGFLSLWAACRRGNIFFGSIDGY